MLLVLRALKLGDLLVTVPALRALRRRFGGHRIVLAAPLWLEPVVTLIDGVDELLPTPGLGAGLPIPPRHVDIAVNLHGNGAESRALIDALEARIKMVHRSPSDPAGVPWIAGMHERVRWARLVTAYGAPADPEDVGIAVPRSVPLVRDAAVVHMGAAYGSRLWPVTRFAHVARALRGDGMRVVVTGAGADVDRARAVADIAQLRPRDVFAGTASLGQFAAVIAAAAVVVTGDTGAAHLASAFGTPSVVLFGPAPVSRWGPPAGPHLVLTDETVRRGDVFAEHPDPALLAVSEADVVAAARSVRGRAGDRCNP